MLAAQRQALIVDEVNRVGAVRVAQLAESLRVSDMTVRRDLDILAEAGLVEKVHGGATSVGDRRSQEPAFSDKAGQERAAKDAIAARAAQLIEPGMAIAVSGGTTTCAVAKYLGGIPQLTVVTNSLPFADAMHTQSDCTVILTGGQRTPTNALVGAVAVDTLRRLNVDVVLLGTHGMDGKAGFTSPNLLEAQTNAALVECGRQLVVLADSTKWGTVSLSAMAALDRADILITDDRISTEAQRDLSDVIDQVVLVTLPDTHRDTKDHD